MEKPKSRKRLNALQKDILLALYKFRFVTRDLIVEYQGHKSKTYTYYRLKFLVEQGYIGKRFNNFDKINRRPVVYHILPKGIGSLKQEPNLNKTIINAMYKDRSASQEFMDRCLTAFAIYNKLNQLYSNRLNFYSKSELSEYDYFLKPLSDAYFTIENKKTPIQHFLLEQLSSDKPVFAHRKRIEHHLDHYEFGNWEEIGDEYPQLLLICAAARLERRLQQVIANLFDRRGVEEVSVFTTTTKALLGAQTNREPIWSDVCDPEELITI